MKHQMIKNIKRGFNYDLASGTMYVWNAEAEDFEATKLSEL